MLLQMNANGTAPVAPPKKGGTILIVEDNADQALAIKDMLTVLPVFNPIEMLRSGNELMIWLEGGFVAEGGNMPYPALILLDINLPGMSGMDILIWLRASKHHTIPVIMLSGMQNWKMMEEAYSLGAFSFIAKPPNPDDVRNVFRALGITL